MTHTVKVIALDGPSGSGKSTIAKLAAKKLNLTYIDTGAMFRALAYFLKDFPIDFDQIELSEKDREYIASALDKMNFEYAPSEDILIRIDGEDLTSKIREHDISKLASLTSRYPVVRDYLKKIQREIALARPTLLDGRDIGTVIFPDAPLKFFITASSTVRAQRRLEQLKESGQDQDFSLEQIKNDIEERDAQDMNRAVAPLKKAEDALLIDTSHLTIEEVLSKIELEFNKKKDLFFK